MRRRRGPKVARAGRSGVRSAQSRCGWVDSVAAVGRSGGRSAPSCCVRVESVVRREPSRRGRDSVAVRFCVGGARRRRRRRGQGEGRGWNLREGLVELGFGLKGNAATCLGWLSKASGRARRVRGGGRRGWPCRRRAGHAGYLPGRRRSGWHGAQPPLRGPAPAGGGQPARPPVPPAAAVP